ncbi:hypothetical protein lerEdw1_003910 [Lerista edwardsae]|nr:hypothetical protein lerEdw1_003910 [Lerista edwardsae]
MTEPLEQGPLFFFDQPKIKKYWDRIIGLGEQFAYLNSSNSNSYETGCIHRHFGCTEEHTERNDALMKNGTAKQDPGSPQTCDPSVFRTICEDSLAQLSQKSSDPLTEEVLQLTLLEECKGMALTMLGELEETLNQFSKHKFVLPQGVLNILPCSWEELTEDACCMEKPGLEPAYKSIQVGRWQTSEEGNRLSPTSEYVDCEVAAEGTERQRRRNRDFPAGVTKGAKNPETLLNKLNGNKTVVSEQYASDSPVAISFSLSSKLPKERGIRCSPLHLNFSTTHIGKVILTSDFFIKVPVFNILILTIWNGKARMLGHWKDYDWLRSK